MAIATHEHFPQWTSAGISCPPDRGSCPEKDKARQGEQVAPSEFKAIAPGMFRWATMWATRLKKSK